jgi:hypothetical protein
LAQCREPARGYKSQRQRLSKHALSLVTITGGAVRFFARPTADGLF